ncbi:hypothetical protein JFN87_25200 [Streptomyces bomunensis]|uniref:ARB-07466-like C-terminal domain-containing protein n=1 Tax=Streptomyces montanisoli TaxID=2798581 RepID=A0A940RZZ2_9ACTN|nr:hypothetical protein [Streptomyces montanisoli]MBP0460748.1 hypothetical protein [Streptomyces montanisoli]
MTFVSETSKRSRGGRFLRWAAAFVVLIGVASYAGVQYVTGGGSAPTSCTVRASKAPNGGGETASYELSPEQAANAATISAVGITRGMPERAVTIALATAIQESGLRNLPQGDRDSVGLFQQRPSAGWGTREQILDPVYASKQFYTRLAKVHGYGQLPLTVAAQRVQHSGFPGAYAKHEADASLLAAAFTGQAPAVLTCPGPVDREPGDPAKVRAALVEAFGPGVLPSKPKTAPAGSGTSGGGGTAVSGTAAVAASAPPDDGVADARTPDASAGELSVPVRALPGSGGGSHGEMAAAATEQRGWELAHWAVAQAGVLRLERVAYAGRVWSAQDAGAGWQRVDKSGNADDTSTSEVTIAFGQ